MKHQRPTTDKPHEPDAARRSYLASAVKAAAEKQGLLQELRAILVEAQAAIDRYAPHCRGCGKCCDFEQLDHRLFCTTAELALLTTDNPPSKVPPLRCCYQTGQICTARGNRPLGCRMFFCDEKVSGLYEDIYEDFHRRITELHHRWDVEYYYIELSEGLSQLLRGE